MRRVLKWWPALLVVVAIVVAVVIWRLPSSSGEAEATALTRVFPVERGDLTASISPTGEVYAPRQANLSFDVNKLELIELHVAPGQKVEEGDVLAKIEIDALERAVIQAEADLTVAQDNLDQVENPYSELDVLQAQTAVEQAEVALLEAQENLESIQEPATELDLAKGQVAVEQANVALQEAQESWDSLRNPDTDLDLAKARLAVSQAEVSLADALDKLEHAKAGPTASDLTSAEASLKSAQEKYDDLLAKPTEADIQAAEWSLERAKNSLWSAQSSRDASCGAAAEGRGSSSACVSGKVNVANQEIGVQQAEIAYLDAQKPATEAELASAMASVEKAQEALDDLEEGPSAVAIAQAENQVAQAEYNVAQARADLADVEAGIDAVALAKAESQVAQAEYNLAKAKSDLDDIRAGIDAVALAKSESQVAKAESDLANAQEKLAETQAGADPDDVEVTEAKLISAQANLEAAQDALEAATLVAPFDGTIISVGVEVGDLVSSNVNIVTIADLTDLREYGIVDETDITKLEIGQLVETTFDAFPGRKFWGEVLEVPLQGKLVQNILTYEVPLSLQGGEDVALKPGMTANLKIVVGHADGALLVPTMAIQQGEDGNVVYIQSGPEGATEATLVQTGLSSGTYTQIVAGLVEGDQVVVTYEAATGQGGFFGMGVPMGAARRVLR